MISDPASIAWLLNIRGDDVPFTPFALSIAVAHADGSAELFIDTGKTRAWLGNAVSVAPRGALGTALKRLDGKRVRVDAAATPVWFAQCLRKAGAVVVAAMIHACCQRPARTRSSSRVPEMRICGMQWR
ncbi:MAG: aminopeptidase P family N-terminal domain-containing protein [Acetobacteraceae bacterium]